MDRSAFSALCVRYRDMRQVWQVLNQLAEQLGGTSGVLVPLAVIFATLALGLWLFNREAPLVAERA